MSSVVSSHRMPNLSAATAPESAAAERGFRIALGLIAVGAFGLRLVRLGAQSLWIDEVLSLGWIGEIHQRGYASLLGDIHGPLHAALLELFSRLSMREWCLRLPSALAGALSVPAVGLLARALWERRVGLTAAGLLALSPFALYYSQECRNYALTILFAITSLGAALAFVRQPDTRHALLLAGSELLGIASNLNGLFFALGLTVWVWWQIGRNRPAWRRWLACHVGLAALLVPYAWGITHQIRPERLVGVETGFGQEEPLRGETRMHPMALPYTVFAFAAGYSLGPTLQELHESPRAAAAPRHAPAVALTMLGFGLPLLAGIARRDGAAKWSLLLVPVLATLGFTVWLALTNIKPYNVRYLSVALPSFVLLVASGLWRLPRRWGVVAAVAALVVSVWSCFDYFFVPRYGRDDVRGVVDYVAEHAGPEDAVVQIALSGPLLHYYDRLGMRWVHPPDAAAASETSARGFAAEIAPRSGVIWYLECRPQSLDPHGYLRRALQGRSRSEESRDFPGIRVFRFQIETPAAPP